MPACQATRAPSDLPHPMHPEAGQAGLFIVLNLGLLFAVLALTVDLGWAYYRRQVAQSAADAAALAATTYAQQNGFTCGSGGVTCGAETACNYPNTTPATTNYHVGCLYAGVNDFYNNGSQTVTMTGNTTTPPGTTGNAPAYWVKATVTETGYNLFARFGGISSFSVNASAIAGVSLNAPTGCIFVLATTGAAAMSLTGATNVTTGCGIWINSSSTGALTVTGSSVVNATSVGINGGTATITGTSVVTPTPNTSAGTVIDPLASLPMPSVGACNFTNYSLGSSNTATINPGVYCGGITVTGAARLTVNAGTYILNGGGLNVGNSGIVTGSGVTFFNTGQSGRTPAPMNFTGASVLTLTAPSSGTYQGMLFVQDRNITYTGVNNFTGSTSSTFTGTLYFPSTALKYTGASTGTFTAIIAKTLSFTGSSNIKNDPTGLYTGLGGRSSAIIQ